MSSGLLRSIFLVASGGLASYEINNLLNKADEKEGLRGWLLKSNKVNDKDNEQITAAKLKSNQNICIEEFSETIAECKKKLDLWRSSTSIPGYTIGVSVRGQQVWLTGDGFADLENAVPCTGSTVMRIASISKSMTASLLGKMLQENKIDLDKPIQEYLTSEEWPDKYWEGKKVDITLRQLVSHLGGIRHYKKNDSKETEFEKKEYYITEHFPTAIKSLSIFKDDPLVAKPGTEFVYTTFGWTLISAVMESQMSSKNFGKEFIKYLNHDLGLTNTYLEEYRPLIPARARFYSNNDSQAKLINTPYVDNSYKWAGGGLLSTAGDLLKFGNMMLYSFKGVDPFGRPGFLQQSIVDQMWTPVGEHGYGIGFVVNRNKKAKKAFTAEPPYPTLFSHTGGAIGATSVLLIEPQSEIVIALITNLGAAMGISRIATQVLNEFTKKIKNKNNNNNNQQ